MGFNCNRFSIKLVKIAQDIDLATWLMIGLGLSTHERACEKHMWKFKS